MANAALITAVDQALAALKAARKVLVAEGKQSSGSKSIKKAKNGVADAKPARRGMSEEGRLRVAAAQRKRWAVAKRAAKKAARLAGK